MKTITILPIKALRGRVHSTATHISRIIQHTADVLMDIIIKILFMIISPHHFVNRASNSHKKLDQPLKVELYEAIMHPDDNMELVNVLFDLRSGLWKLDSKPTDKQLGRLLNREDRVLLLCTRKLVEAMAKGRHGESTITVEDAHSKWQTKHVLVNRLSAPGHKDPFGNLPHFGSVVQGGRVQDLLLSSHDIFHIRNLQAFLLCCSRHDTSGPMATKSILKSWMVTMPQILSILEDKLIMRTCKATYWELFRRGHIGLTVYLQIHDGDNSDEPLQTFVSAEPLVSTADTRAVAALRLTSQVPGSGSTTGSSYASRNEAAQIPTARARTAGSQTPADQAVHPYGRGFEINDPQTYFQKFSSLVPPEQATNILLALNFFLRPPELDWENFPSEEQELRQSLPKTRPRAPEVFIVSRRPDSRTAPLSDLTRIAASAIHSQSEANGNSIDVLSALQFLGKTPVQGHLRRTRLAASNDEIDTLRSPIYHQTQHSNPGLPVHFPQVPADMTGKKEATSVASTEKTMRAANSVRVASAETTGTVQVHMQPSENSTMPARSHVHGNGDGHAAGLNPAATPFTSSTMPSISDHRAKRDGGPSIATGSPSTIKSGNTKGGRSPKRHNWATHPNSWCTSANLPLSLDGESVAAQEGSESPSAGSDEDTEQGGTRPAEK